MAATPYKSVSWADNEPIFTSKLNNMAANDQWLFENTPRMQYSAYDNSIKRAESLKIACGIATCAPSTNGIQRHVVYFGSFFSTACRPVLVTELQHQGEVRFHWGVKGIGTTHIDSRGFEILGGADVTGTWNRMTKTFWIHWIAMGY